MKDVASLIEYPLIKNSNNFHLYNVNNIPQNFRQTINSNEWENEKKPFTFIDYYYLPTVLLSIKKEIKKSKGILNLKNDWDEDGAIAPPKPIYDRAITFLTVYSEAAYMLYGITIMTPSINPARDGSIDLEWKTPNYELLINILNTPTKIVAHYYGDNKKNNNVIEGKLYSFEPNEDLIYWMKKLKEPKNVGKRVHPQY